MCEKFPWKWCIQIQNEYKNIICQRCDEICMFMPLRCINIHGRCIFTHINASIQHATTLYKIQIVFIEIEIEIMLPIGARSNHYKLQNRKTENKIRFVCLFIYFRCDFVLFCLALSWHSSTQFFAFTCTGTCWLKQHA